MNDYHIIFKSLDDLLRFLIDRKSTGGRASCWENVHLVDSQYVLCYDSSDWDGIGNRFGGIIQEGQSFGNPVGIRELLEKVVLRRVPISFNAGTETIVLAIPVKDELDANASLNYLYKAWQKVERSDSARSAFHTCKSTTDQGWHAVQIDGVSPSFDYSKFKQENRELWNADLRVFAPAWNGGGCFLFVDWEYSYPKAAEFAQLYRETSGGLILCKPEQQLDDRNQPSAGATNGERVMAKGGPASWWVPSWHEIDGDEYYTVSDLFQVATQETVTSLTYSKDESYALRINQRPLEISSVSEAIGSTRELEMRIGSLEGELELLHAKQDRLSLSSHQEFFSVYKWEQKQGEKLPDGLAKLLSKPLGELARYLYLPVETENGSLLHYVALREHQKFGTAAVMDCDSLYLCDARWMIWQLPLFVRHDCALSIDINEEDLASMVRGAIPDPDAVGADVLDLFCLVEPSDGQNKLPAFTWLAFSNSLEDVVALINGSSSGPASALRSSGLDASRAPVSSDVALSESSALLDVTLRRRTELRLRESEEGWEQTRQELQAAAFRTRVGEIVMHSFSKVRDEIPDKWNLFVERTLKADAAAIHFKIAQLGDSATRDTERRELLLKHEEGLVEVERVINERNASYDELFVRIENRNKGLAIACKELDEKLKQLKEQEAKLEAKQVELKAAALQLQARESSLNAANGRLESHIRTIEQHTRNIEGETDKRAQLTQKLSNAQLGEENARQAFELNGIELDNALKHFRLRLREGHQLERTIASQNSWLQKYLPAFLGGRRRKP